MVRTEDSERQIIAHRFNEAELLTDRFNPVKDGSKTSYSHEQRYSDPVEVPGENYGIYADEEDELIVIDVDDYRSEVDEKVSSIQAINRLPPTLEVETPHDTGVPQHRYAYDFVITDDKGSTYDKAASGTDPATHYCYGEPVLAPADGTVVNATDSRNDSSRANGAPAPTYRSIYGNYVVIDHGDMVTVLAHLQQGSLTVQVGDTIEQGEQIASCGYSGNASEPQLHMHVQDRSRLSIGIGLPARFDATDTRHLDGDFMNDKQAIVHCGQGVKTRKPTDQS